MLAAEGAVAKPAEEELLLVVVVVAAAGVFDDVAVLDELLCTTGLTYTERSWDVVVAEEDSSAVLVVVTSVVAVVASLVVVVVANTPPVATAPADELAELLPEDPPAVAVGKELAPWL